MRDLGEQCQLSVMQVTSKDVPDVEGEARGREVGLFAAVVTRGGEEIGRAHV